MSLNSIHLGQVISTKDFLVDDIRRHEAAGLYVPDFGVLQKYHSTISISIFQEGRYEATARYNNLQPIPCATRTVIPNRVYASKNFPMLTR